MKSIILALMLFSSSAFADTYVRGHFRRNGTYVQPHFRSSPNYTTQDNWSTRGNVNPYTGQQGTKSADDYKLDGSSLLNRKKSIYDY